LVLAQLRSDDEERRRSPGEGVDDLRRLLAGAVVEGERDHLLRGLHPVDERPGQLERPGVDQLVAAPRGQEDECGGDGRELLFHDPQKCKASISCSKEVRRGSSSIRFDRYHVVALRRTMTNTATGSPAPAAASTGSGPLLRAWGAAASPGTLARVLLDPGRALPPADLRSELSRRALEPVRERAEAERGSPWPQPLASQYARYFQDGDRTGYEENVFGRQARLTRAVLMAAATGDDGWLAEAADGIVLLCEQSSWCWPAHGASCRPRGTALPDPASPCLDLGAGDVAAQLAWADQALGERLDERFPGLRERVRAEVRTRVLEPFTRRRDWHWLGLDGHVHNWCPWICGNVLVAALRLAEPGEERALQVALAVEGIDRYLGALPADGSVDEGYEYWWNGACRALEALDVLAHATAGA